MKTTSSLAIGLLALAVHASPAPASVQTAPASSPTGSLSLPPGSKDGLYVHTVNADGTPGLTYLGPVNTTHAARDSGLAPPVLGKRAKKGSYCQGFYLNPTDVMGAEDGLVGYCNWDDPAVFSKAISYQSGNAVAYGCNYGNGQKCYGNQIQPFFNQLTSDCGGNQAAWYSYPDWKVSYGVTGVGNSYC